MEKPLKPREIDKIIHERVRLAIVSTLAVVPEMSHNELKRSLLVTDGNLSIHSRTLEEAGYIKINKKFRGRKPLTTMSLTAKGRKAFKDYVRMLQEVVDRGKKGQGESGGNK